MSVFDIDTPIKLFNSIRSRYITYLSPMASGGRSTEDMLYIIMMLNHLRDWIAPRIESNWDTYRPEVSEAKRCFSEKLRVDNNYKIINDIANGVKHLKKGDMKTSVSGGATLKDWYRLSAVQPLSNGPPTGHFIDSVPVQKIIEPIIKLYEEWFSQDTDES